MARRDSTMASFRESGEFIVEKLIPLMPNGRRIDADPDGQMQLTVTDRDSQQAALVTLQKFGAGVDLYAVADIQVYIRFADEDQGSQAVRFYNRLPKNMSKYKPS